VFRLDHFEIGALSLGGVDGDADALARDDVTAEIFEKMRAFMVLGSGFSPRGPTLGKLLRITHS
jgi:hypothetical protein